MRGFATGVGKHSVILGTVSKSLDRSRPGVLPGEPDRRAGCEGRTTLDGRGDLPGEFQVHAVI